MSNPPSQRPVAFILGAPRSGTTLLRVMLAGHPQLFSPPEMVIAPFETMAQRREIQNARFWEKGGLRRALMELNHMDVDQAKVEEDNLGEFTVPEVYTYLQARLGDKILVDKCPHLAGSPEAMDRLLTWFPDARFLWILRHPGSVTRSLENMPMAEVMLTGYSHGASDLWLEFNRNIETFLSKVPSERWAMVKYEEMVTDPRPVMEVACHALGVPFDEATLNPYEGDRMREGPKGARAIGDPNMSGRGKIQPELASAWLEGFDPLSVSAQTHQFATRYGYDLEGMSRPPLATVRDGMKALWDLATELESSIHLPMDLDAVEGRRFLMRLVSYSLDLFVENGDPDHPRITHAEGPTRKVFGDNPDADYLRATIQSGPGRVYRLWGRIPAGTLYVSFLLYRKGGKLGNRLVDHQLHLDEEGRFEVLISSDVQQGDWLACDGDETAVIVRQYFTNRSRQAPIELHIEKLGDIQPPPPLDARLMARQLEKARRNVEVTFKRTLGAYQQASVAALNRFMELPAEGLFPTPDNRYLACWFRFGYNQVMLVRGVLPRARYFSFVVYNAWLESYDYLHHTVLLNHEQLKVSPDGSFELCLAHRDPGHPNWLDTAGHHAGYLVARCLLPEGELPDFSVQVMYESEWETLKGQRGR